MKPVQILKGHTELVEDQARIATAYLPDDDEDGRLPRPLAWAINLAIAGVLWWGIVATVMWALG